MGRRFRRAKILKGRFAADSRIRTRYERGKFQPGCDHAQLAQRARLELADTLAGDAEADSDLFQRLRDRTVQAEALGEDVAHARIQAVERS